MQQGTRKNLWVSTVGTACLLHLCGAGAVKRVYHEGRTRVSKLNTTAMQGLDSPDDILLYRSKQYFSGCEDRKKVLTAKRPHCSSFRAKMAPPTTTFSWVEHHAYKVMNEPQARMMALLTS